MSKTAVSFGMPSRWIPGIKQVDPEAMPFPVMGMTIQLIKLIIQQHLEA